MNAMEPNDTVQEISRITRVVHILGESRVAINKKPIPNIKLNDRLSIFELTEDIKDPISSENLGKLRIYKGTGKVVDIQDTMAIVQSDREGIQPILVKMAVLGGPTPLMPFNNPKIGDFAVLI